MVKSNETSKKILLKSLGFKVQQDELPVLKINNSKAKTINNKTNRSKL